MNTAGLPIVTTEVQDADGRWCVEPVEWVCSCGARVVRAHSRKSPGKTYTAQVDKVWRGDEYGTERVYGTFHECPNGGDSYYSVYLPAVEAAKAAKGIVTKGCTVKVVKGRKVPKGTVATVAYVNVDSPYGVSVLLTMEDGTHVWTADTNLERI